MNDIKGYMCNIQHSGVDRNGREFYIDENADYVQDRVFELFHQPDPDDNTIVLSDFGRHLLNFPLVIIQFICNRIYREKYFDFFFHIYHRKTIIERLSGKDGFFAFSNEIDNSVVYIKDDKNYRFDIFIENTNYRLYYNHKIEPFDYDKTIADLYEKYYYLRMKIFRDVCLYGTEKISYEDCDRIIQELAKEFKYPYKKNGFYDKFQLGRLGENYYIWQK